ncbi:MAG: hypothetical protein H6799_02225 [Candidatus Nomurabacteria bacterium]|nr:MAG: hypothetical protein H6799_02225 [Candidatus Nomurabacteria bacterium]HRV76044.1 hypothetical protein [Candidatus Saccharimonadales bacterium]
MPKEVKKKNNEQEIKELKERLSVLEKIEAEKLKPKSEIRTTGKQYFPLVLGVFFALCSGVAIYGVTSSVRFYSDYGDTSSLLVSLFMLFSLIILVGAATWAIHRSEWGYRLRYTVIFSIVLFSSIGIGAVLMQGPVERFVDKLGINNNLRAEDRLLNESTIYGKITDIKRNNLKISLMGGGEINVGIDGDTKVFPMGAEIRENQVVGVILKSDSKIARWVRVLPANHPAGRNIR